MKVTLWFLLAPLLFGLAVFAEERSEMTNDTVQQLSWLAGKWAGDFEGNQFEANYTDARGGAILSTNKEYLPDGACYVEFEQFHIKDGAVVMTPYPGGSRSVDFTLIDFDPEVKKAHFQNLEHDFPTDIIYEITEEGHLHIEVSGPAGDSTRTLVADLKRTE